MNNFLSFSPFVFPKMYWWGKMWWCYQKDTHYFYLTKHFLVARCTAMFIPTTTLDFDTHATEKGTKFRRSTNHAVHFLQIILSQPCCTEVLTCELIDCIPIIDVDSSSTTTTVSRPPPRIRVSDPIFWSTWSNTLDYFSLWNNVFEMLTATSLKFSTNLWKNLHTSAGIVFSCYPKITLPQLTNQKSQPLFLKIHTET